MSHFTDHQRAVQNFGQQSSALGDYINSYDADFFSNWRDRTKTAQDQLDNVNKIVTGVGEAYTASKMIGQTAKQIGARIAGDDSQEVTAPDEDESITPLFEDEESAIKPTTLTQDSELGDTATQQAILDTDPDEIAGLGGNLQDIINTSNVADESGTALDTALNTAGDVIDTAVGIGSTALDFLGPVGILAGVGISLYEALNPHQRPSVPNVVTASSKGEMVIPSADGVTDTSASMSAF